MGSTGSLKTAVGRYDNHLVDYLTLDVDLVR